MKENKNLIIDSFKLPEGTKWQLDEYAKEKIVDGQYILGRVVGPMFAPDGDSLNGRHYPKKLWELALERNQDRLNHGDVLGTLGHDQALDDTALAEGKVSHKVVRMWIDENTGAGMGEIHILGTESGKALNALLRGGVKLQVSTRATGELSNRKSKNGLPIIDEDSYSFQGIDFVRRGGIPSASPVLVENKYEIIPNIENVEPLNDSPIKEKNMSNELLESLAKEKGKLQDSLTEALNTNKTLSTELDALRRTVDDRQNEVKRVVESLEENKKKVTDLEGKLADSGNSVKAFEKLGTAEKVSEELTSLRALVAEYNEFGTPAQLTQAYAKVDELVEKYKPLGSPEAISSLLDEAASVSEFGNADELKEKLDALAVYEDFSSVEDLTKLSEMLDAYAPLGTPDDINKAFSAFESVISKVKSEKLKNEAVEISKKFKVKVETIEEMLTKNGKELTVKLLEELAPVAPEPNVASRYSKSATKETNVSESVESTDEGSAIQKSRADMLMERFSRVTHPTKNQFPMFETE